LIIVVGMLLLAFWSGIGLFGEGIPLAQARLAWIRFLDRRFSGTSTIWPAFTAERR
jgi:hypothetical protein